MKQNSIPNTLILVLGALFAATMAQQILPFPSVPSGAQAGVTMETSIYKKRVEPGGLPRMRRTSSSF